MIVPNLMVTEMGRSIAFYRDVIGMTLTMTVSPDQEVDWPAPGSRSPSPVTFPILAMLCRSRLPGFR